MGGGWLIGVVSYRILSNSGNKPLPTLGRDSPSIATIADLPAVAPNGVECVRLTMTLHAPAPSPTRTIALTVFFLHCRR